MSTLNAMMVVRTIAVVLVSGALTVPLAAQAPTPGEQDPIVGTWELDIAASTFKPGPAPKSEIRVYEPEHEGIKATIVTTFADGRRVAFEYVTSYNDVIAAVTGSQTSDAIQMRKVDAYTAEANLLLGGRIVGQTTRTVARDRETMTITLRRTAPTEVNDINVYRRR
jgi:hypothetical protein